MKSSPFFFNRSRHSFIFRTPCDTDLEMDWPTDLLDYLEAYQVIITHTIEIQTTKRMTFKKLTRIWIWCWIKIKRRINTLCFSNPLCISFWVHFSFFIDKEVVSSSPSRSYSYYYSSSLPRIIFTLNHHYYHHNPLLVVHAGHGGNFIHFFFLSFFCWSTLDTSILVPVCPHCTRCRTGCPSRCLHQRQMSSRRLHSEGCMECRGRRSRCWRACSKGCIESGRGRPEEVLVLLGMAIDLSIQTIYMAIWNLNDSRTCGWCWSTWCKTNLSHGRLVQREVMM